VNPLERFLGESRAAVDAELDRLLPAAHEPPERLHEALRYSVFAGGKRVRPALLLLAGEVTGARRADLLAGAAALEMIHTYSLVHDDLPALDDDDLRRGRPTVHRQFDEATAILAGDSLLTLGLTVLAAEPAKASASRRRRAVELVGEAIGTRGMIGGQMGDLEAEDRWPDDAPAMLEWIHRRKTGALIRRRRAPRRGLCRRARARSTAPCSGSASRSACCSRSPTTCSTSPAAAFRWERRSARMPGPEAHLSRSVRHRGEPPAAERGGARGARSRARPPGARRTLSDLIDFLAERET
jgi:hypothetical protein